MINYNLEGRFETQLKDNIKELEGYKNSYNKKIEMYLKHQNYMKNLYEDETQEEEKNILEILIKKTRNIVKEFNKQISKINRNIELLNSLLKNHKNSDENEIIKKINQYNKKYKEIKRNIIVNTWIYEEKIMLDYMQTREKELEEKKTEVETNLEQDTEANVENNIKPDDKNIVKNNDTLLVSEILGKVILPYRGEEIKQILEKENSKYNSPEEVIEDKFTRNLLDYTHQFKARYNETIELVTQREKYKKTDAITLALEMMKKRYLHPAIITACRSLDELDVYLDCLEKNELDDFKIFKIKYELHPTIVNNQNDITEKMNIIKKIFNIFKKIFTKNTKKGKRYI